MFVDSHCHLDRLDPRTHGGDLAAALDAARARGVRQFLAIGVTLDEVPGVAAIAREHDDVVISAGVHPLHSVDQEPGVEAIKEVAERFGAVAIGECGLDRSEEHTSELQSRPHLVCRLLLEKKKSPNRGQPCPWSSLFRLNSTHRTTQTL